MAANIGLMDVTIVKQQLQVVHLDVPRCTALSIRNLDAMDGFGDTILKRIQKLHRHSFLKLKIFLHYCNEKRVEMYLNKNKDLNLNIFF